MSDKKDPQTDPLSEAFSRVLERIRDDLEKAELKSWDYLQEKIEAAVELEQAAEELTRDEIELLSQYVKRDLGNMGDYLHETGEGVASWLNFDLNILEERCRQLLLDLGDRTRVDMETLREQLDSKNDDYIAGEIAAAGTLLCRECGHALQLKYNQKIPACLNCGSRYYSRVSVLTNAK